MTRRFALLLGITLAAIVGGAPSPAADTPAQAVAGPAAVFQRDEPAADPFPIHRVRTTEPLLPDLLRQLDVGPLVRLPRNEFEARVRAAGRALADARLLPRITDTRFRGTLMSGDLIGTAEFDIVNLATTPRFLPLDSLRLALGSATWADGREAVIGIPPRGTGAAVWVDRPGRQTLRFAWSLAGIAELGERRFELRTPLAATAELTLELPDKQMPALPAANALLTGPFPVAGNPPRAEWRLRFGGRPRLDFAVRPAGNPGAIAAAALVATYHLAPGQLTCGFEYDLRPAKGTIGEWVFAVDAGLHITDVVVNNRAGWSIDPPPAPGQPRTLRVSLHQPGAGGKVLVSAVAAFPGRELSPDGRLPAVRPVSANLDDELVTIHLTPGLKPENWQPGDYRLTETQVLADQSRSLSLTGTLLPSGADRPFRLMPALRVGWTEADFVTTEQVVWRFDSDRATAELRMGIRVRRGSLFQFGLHEPPFPPRHRETSGYRLIRVTSSPDNLVSYTATSSGPTPGIVTVEFSRPLQAGQSAELLFEFAGPSLATAPLDLPFPTFVPLGAAERTGVLAITSEPLWSIDPVPGTGARPAAWFDLAEPGVPPDAISAFRYRGASAAGMAKLAPVRAAFTVGVATSSAPQAGIRTTFALRVQSGGFRSLMIQEHKGSGRPRTWSVVGGGNAVESAIALPVPALANPLGLLADSGGAGSGPERLWLIRFVRPVTDEVTLETTEPFATPSGTGETWSVPGAIPGPASPLSPGRLRAPGMPARAWAFSDEYLVTVVRSPLDVVAVFGGTIDSSAGTSLPLQLPVGAKVESANVGERWLEPGGCRLSAEGLLQLPVSGSGPARFEVRYRLPVEARSPLGHVRSSGPDLPGKASPVRRWWVFAPDVLPVWSNRAWDRGTAADLPRFLGDSPATWAGGLLVLRTDAEDVRFATARSARVIGFALAAGLLALIWASARRGHTFWALMTIAAVLALGGANLLGPPWWQSAAAIPLFAGLVATAGTVAMRGRPRARTMVLAAGLIACLHLETRARPATPALVAILDVQGREVVVAPKSVLDRLVVAPQQPGVVLSASTYSIRADDAGAQVVAKYTAHVLSDGEAIATLPLADARLEKVTVNSAAAFPSAPRPGVYTVALPGRGRHEIAVSFAVPLGGTGTERELRFGVPECPTTHLTADLPGAARQAQVVGRIGRRMATESERVKVEADVGAVKTLHLRWREGTGGTASVKVREGCIWDVSETGAELTACYLVRVEQGTVGDLQFRLPAELDPIAITARSLDPNGTAALRDWTLGKEENSYRPLRIDFQAPTAGRLLVVLTCAPRKPITRQPLLRFPRPVVPGGPGEPEAAYGLRASGVVIEDPGRSGVIDYAPEALNPDFGRVAELWRNPNAPLRMFRPTPGGNPELRPTLRVAAEPASVTLATTWQVGPTRADAAGLVHWSGGRAVPGLVEFHLPGAKVLEVRGTDVANWNQAGTLVQVWLRRAVREGELEWVASMAASSAPFDAGVPRPVGLNVLGDTVRLQAVEGYAIHVERDRGWTALEGSGGLPAFTTTSATAPPVRIRLAPAPRPGPKAAAPAQAPARPPPRGPDILGPHAPANGGHPPGGSTAVVPPDAPRWVWPVSAAVGWVAASLVLGVLLVRLPQTTWPEQFALVAGLFGAALGGYWWIGLPAWALARFAWLLEDRFAVPPRPEAVRS